MLTHDVDGLGHGQAALLNKLVDGLGSTGHRQELAHEGRGAAHLGGNLAIVPAEALQALRQHSLLIGVERLAVLIGSQQAQGEVHHVEAAILHDQRHLVDGRTALDGEQHGSETAVAVLQHDALSAVDLGEVAGQGLVGHEAVVLHVIGQDLDALEVFGVLDTRVVARHDVDVRRLDLPQVRGLRRDVRHGLLHAGGADQLTVEVGDALDLRLQTFTRGDGSMREFGDASGRARRFVRFGVHVLFPLRLLRGLRLTSSPRMIR